MPVLVGVDLGTTKITSIAVDASSGEIVAIGSATNDANITSDADRARSRSEWQAEKIFAAACRCLAQMSQQLGSKVSDVAGIGVTGQQHGMVLVDAELRPVSPLINWQDRRALDRMPDSDLTWLEAARAAIGHEAWRESVWCRRAGHADG